MIPTKKDSALSKERVERFHQSCLHRSSIVDLKEDSATGLALIAHYHATTQPEEPACDSGPFQELIDWAEGSAKLSTLSDRHAGDHEPRKVGGTEGLDLGELERLEKAAFRAPWKYSRWCIGCETCNSDEGDECVDPYCDGNETECVTIESPDEYPDGQVVAQLSGEGISVPGILDLADRNGELIVALRNAGPALIKAARERDELREQCEGLHGQLDQERIACTYNIQRARRLEDAATQLWDALAEKQTEYEYTVDRGVGHLIAFSDAKIAADTLRARVAELEKERNVWDWHDDQQKQHIHNLKTLLAATTIDLETQRELYGVAAKEREAAIARVAELEADLAASRQASDVHAAARVTVERRLLAAGALVSEWRNTYEGDLATLLRAADQLSAALTSPEAAEGARKGGK